MKLIPENNLPIGFAYPSEFLKIIDQGLVDLDPWVIMEGDYLLKRYKGLKERFASKQLVPFARRLSNDDLAAWDLELPGKVIIIHDFASPGWEQKETFDSFWLWFRKAIEDMIDHDA